MVFRDSFSMATHKVFLGYRTTLAQRIIPEISINVYDANINIGIFHYPNFHYMNSQTKEN